MYEDNFFPLFLNLDKFLKNSAPGKITYMYIWQIERDKVWKEQIHFLNDVFNVVIVIIAFKLKSSLMLNSC